MENERHHSSVQVMFSDKGSTFLGVFSVFLMLMLSFTLFFLKVQKTPLPRQKEIKNQKIFLHPSILKNSKVLFYPLTSQQNLVFHKVYTTPQKIDGNQK
jgi:hypothetical protein